MNVRLALLPLFALLGACSALPETQQAERTPVKRSTLFFTPNPETRQCLSQLGSARASFTPRPVSLT